MRLVSILTFVTFSCWGQSNTFPSSGSVGIGTTNPGGKLEINHAGGQLKLTGGTVAAGIFTNATNLLHVADWNTATNGLTVNLTNGNVGIGTASPAAKLEVKQAGGPSGQNTAMKLWAGNTGNYFGNSQILLAYGGGGSFAHAVRTRHHGGQLADNAIDFYTWQPGDGVEGVGSLHAMTLNSGRVGIGTTSPSSKVHVSDVGTVEMHLSTDAASTSRSLVSFTRGSAGWNIGMNINQSNNNDLHFRGSGPIYALTLQAGGNVGVGTTTPDAKLSVKGQVHAQEVKVDLNGAIAPDYVFNKAYKLPALEEIKSFIEKNRHLPEVPSAKEMEANGMNLGEMNLILLKKVEELTLYILQQEQRIKSLEDSSKK